MLKFRGSLGFISCANPALKGRTPLRGSMRFTLANCGRSRPRSGLNARSHRPHSTAPVTNDEANVQVFESDQAQGGIRWT